MGSAKKYVKKHVSQNLNSDVGRIAVPVAAAYLSGGLVNPGLPGFATSAGNVGPSLGPGATTAAVGGAAAVGTSQAMGSPDLKSPDTPDMPPPELSTPQDPSAVDRAKRAAQRLAAAAGRGSTILTGGTSLGGAAPGAKTLLGL